jgi:hypothetical protein
MWTRTNRTLALVALGATCVFWARLAGQPLSDGIVFTQAAEGEQASRLVRLEPGGSVRVLTPDFSSAADADVSFDGQRIVFAGKRRAADPWQIYEMQADGTGVRRITQTGFNCRSPLHLPAIFYLDADAPAYQVGFVGHDGPATSLFTSRLDGSGLRRLTFNPYGARDPAMLPDGRLVFSADQRDRLERGVRSRVSLFGINTDGTDYAMLSGDEGGRYKRMPSVTAGGLVVFVEPAAAADSAGRLAAVSLRRNLRSHRVLTLPADGLFHSPSALSGGEILVSRRPAKGPGTFGVYRFDPSTRRLTRIHDDPKWNETQAKVLSPRAEPDGHSSVVDEQDPDGKLYCLSAFTTDFPARDWLTGKVAKRLRVLEGAPPGLERRFLGEINLEDDGSFNVQVPANIPIQLQLVDSDGMALRTCSWIWVKNRENRGCIGCHEDGELAPENVLAKSLTRASIPLTLPPERRRRVAFEKDLRPVLGKYCGGSACHRGAAQPRIDSASALAKHIHPGQARTSPLVWSLFGRATTRPWDGAAPPRAVKKMPPAGSPPLPEDLRRTVIEWIELGGR